MKSCNNQKDIDKLLLKLDGSDNKAKLGANATIATSSAILKAAAMSHKKPLFQYNATRALLTLQLQKYNICNP